MPSLPKATPPTQPGSPYPELRRQSLPWRARTYFRWGRRALAYRYRWWQPYRGWLLLAPVFVCLFGLAAAQGWLGKRFYQSYPVSSVHSEFNDDCHARFNNDCGRCHLERCQTWKRLSPANADMRTVSDQGCQGCHRSLPREQFRSGDWPPADRPFLQGLPALVHHPQQVSADVPRCAACHREHRGKPTLQHVADGYCTDCHRDLRRQDGAEPACLAPVTHFAGGHPDFRYPRDEGQLHFNHHLHAGRGVLGNDGQRVVLDCRKCHEMDPNTDHRYLKPVRYERHCQECHALAVPLAGEWPTEALRAAAAQFRQRPATHGRQPKEVWGELHERYAAFVRDHPAVLKTPVVAEPSRPLPSGPRPRPATDTQETWVAFQLETARRALFTHSGGCRYCHPLTAEAPPKLLPSYAPTNIRSRWLAHSVFSHGSHAKMDCNDCHAAARQSRQTSEVLLPAIRTCQQCHQRPALPGRRDGSDCVLCHRYHDRKREQEFSRTASRHLGE